MFLTLNTDAAPKPGCILIRFADIQKDLTDPKSVNLANWSNSYQLAGCFAYLSQLSSFIPCDSHS
jgi:hypothetical protein